jgi:hypothetical protein
MVNPHYESIDLIRLIFPETDKLFTVGRENYPACSLGNFPKKARESDISGLCGNPEFNYNYKNTLKNGICREFAYYCHMNILSLRVRGQ